MRTKLNDEIESNAGGAGAGGEAEKVEGQGQVQGTNPVAACEGGAEARRQSVATFKPKGSSITLWDNSKCACVHPDAMECAEIRSWRKYPVNPEKKPELWKCQCVCHHDIDQDDLDLT